MQHVPVYEDISDAYIKYLMNHRQSDEGPKVQTYKELLTELIQQEQQYREAELEEQEYDLLTATPEDKKILH